MKYMKRLFAPPNSGHLKSRNHFYFRMDLLETKTIPATISDVAWSQDNELAVTTSKGILCLDILPNPRKKLTNLNLAESFVRALTDPNPYLEQLGIDIQVLADSPSQHLDTSDILLNVKLPESGNGYESVRWTPNGAVKAGSCSLITMTFDRWLKIFSKSNQGWQESFDLSKILHTKLSSSNWKECSTSPKEDKVQALRERMEILCFTDFVWNDITSSLITCSKSGHVILWDMDIESQSMSVAQIYDSKMAGISSLSCYKVTEFRYVLFLGSFDGRLSLLSLTWNENSGMHLEQVGFAWPRSDQARVKCVRILQDSFFEERKLNISVAKETFVCILELQFEGANSNSVKVSRKKCLQVVNWPIVNILPWKGQSADLIIPETDGLTLLSRSNLESEDIMDLNDLKGYKAVSAGSSFLNAIYVIAANISVPYDHLKLRSAAKLVFLTPHTTEEGLEYLSKLDSLSKAKDLLEVVRVQCSKMDYLPTIAHHLMSLTDESRKLQIWLGRLFQSIWKSERDIWQNKLDQLILEQLKDHAKQSLLKSKSNKEAENKLQSLQNFLQISSCKANTKCTLCNGYFEQNSSNEVLKEEVKCSQGHVWPLCILSLEACDSPEALKCLWCDSMANPEALARTSVESCPICDGPFVPASN
jgi:hypothetical protein